MAPPRIDLTGKIFGRLTVLCCLGRIKPDKKVYWECQCSCVNRPILALRTSSLNRGVKVSCGCWGKENSIAMATTHGMTKTSTYRSWAAMKARCFNEKHQAFGLYNGTGITVCERWLEFENFYADMGSRPIGKTLDRYPDKYGNYEPGNCRWATPKEQAHNSRPNRHPRADKGWSSKVTGRVCFRRVMGCTSQ